MKLLLEKSQSISSKCRCTVLFLCTLCRQINASSLVLVNVTVEYLMSYWMTSLGSWLENQMICSLIFYTLSVSGHCVLVATTDQCLESWWLTKVRKAQQSPNTPLVAVDCAGLCAAHRWFFFFFFNLYYYFMCKGILPVCMSVPGAHIGQKKVLDLLGLE